MAASRLGLLSLRRPRAALIGVCLAVALVAAAGIPRIRISGDLHDLLPAGDPRVREMVDLLADAGTTSRLVLALEADSAAALDAAGDAVVRFLVRVAEDRRIHRLEYGLDRDSARALITPRALLLLEGAAQVRLLALLTPEGLRRRALELAARLADADQVALRDRLLADPVGLSDLAMEWLRPQGQGGIGQPLPDGTLPLRSSDGRMLVAFAYPVFSGSDVPRSEELVRDLRQLAAEELAPRQVRLGLTGSHAIGVEMAAVIRGDTILATLDTALAVGLVFFLFYRRFFLVLVVFVPLLLVAALTAGLAGLLADQIHVLAAAAMGLLFGLGDDLFVHYIAALRATPATLPARARNEQALQSVSLPTLLSVLTTAAAFASLLLSGFPGFAQLGWLMAAGMLLFYVVAMLVLPAWFVRRIPVLAVRPDWFDHATGWLSRVVGGRERILRAVALSLLAAGVAVLAVSPVGLRIATEFGAYEAEVEGFRVRDRIGGAFSHVREPWIVAVDGPTLDATLHRNDQVFRRVAPIAGTFLGGTTLRSARFHLASAATLETHRLALAALDGAALGRQWHAELERAGFDAAWAREQGAALEGLVTAAQSPAPAAEPAAASAPANRLVAPFLIQRPDGWRALTLLFSRDAWRGPGDEAPLRQALAEVPGARLGGPGPLRSVLQPLFVRAGLWLLLGELAAMLVILAIGYRSLRQALRVSLPLLTGLAVAGALLKLLDWPLGFGNLGVLPLVVGISIDGAIFLSDAAAAGGGRAAALLRAARPVTVSSLTTILAFGSLVLASHPGLRELGSTAIVCLATCWLCNLLFFAAPPDG